MCLACVFQNSDTIFATNQLLTKQRVMPGSSHNNRQLHAVGSDGDITCDLRYSILTIKKYTAFYRVHYLVVF